MWLDPNAFELLLFDDDQLFGYFTKHLEANKPAITSHLQCTFVCLRFNCSVFVIVVEASTHFLVYKDIRVFERVTALLGIDKMRDEAKRIWESATTKGATDTMADQQRTIISTAISTGSVVPALFQPLVAITQEKLLHGMFRE